MRTSIEKRRSGERTFQAIMNELEKGLEVEVIELADRVGIAKSTAHNLLDKINGRLSEEGYPKRIKSRRADNRNHWRLVQSSRHSAWGRQPENRYE